MSDRDSADQAPGDPALLASMRAAAPDPAPGAAAGAPAPGETTDKPAAPIDWAQEARDLWRIIAMLSLRFPSLERVYTDQAIDRLGAAWAPVLQRHNLDLGKFAIYITAGMATLPVLGETYKAIQHDRAIERAAAAPVAPGAAAAPPAAQAAASAGIPDANQLHKSA